MLGKDRLLEAQSGASTGTTDQSVIQNYLYPARLLVGDSIRLLILQPGSFDEIIHGQLEQVSLNDENAYEALSYVWGDANDTSSMDLNGTLHPISKNLECALRHLRHKEAPRVIWVDAICINQIDEDEKSEQVSKMGEIYSRAMKVYAWLGEASCETDHLFEVLQQFRDRKREVTCPAYFDAAEQLSFYRQLFCDIYQAEVGALPDQCDFDDETLHEEFNWLKPLYSQCYWRRVWIVQELVLAKVVVVCCGDKSIDFDDIYGLSPDWGSFEQGFDIMGCQITQENTIGWNTIRTVRGHRARREIVKWKMEGEALHPISIKMSEKGDVAILDEVVKMYAKYHECSCPKDKIYGFRELVSLWKENLVVDYKKSDLEVFLDVARLGLFDPKQRGDRCVAFCLWSAMGLDNSEDFNDCIRKHLPEFDL